MFNFFDHLLDLIFGFFRFGFTTDKYTRVPLLIAAIIIAAFLAFLSFAN